MIGEGSVKNLPIESAELIVNSGSFNFDFDGKKDAIQSNVHLETTLKGEENTRPIDATVLIKNYMKNGKLDFDTVEVQTQGNFSRFPVSIITNLFAEDFNLRPFIGSAVDFTFQGHYVPRNGHHTNFEIDAKGQGFTATAAVSVDGSWKVSQGKPAYIHWDLTPARYQALMKILRPDQEPYYVLTRAASIDLSITEFLCPSSLPSTFKSFICQSGFVGDLRSEPLHFKSRYTQEEIALVNVNCFIQGRNFSQAIGLQGNGKIVSPIIPVGQSSGFAFNAEMLGFFTPEGAFYRNGMVKGSIDLDLIPVREFTGILPLENENRLQIQALLGPFVNARIFGEVSQLIGPVTVDVKSSNLKAVLPIYLGAQGITLQQNVEAELTLTDAVNETFLKDINPLLITGAWSDHPLKIFVGAEGFFIPLYPMSMHGVQVKSAMVDLGKIRVRNGGPIQSLMEFLKAKDVSDDGVMEAWFTPIYTSIVNGVAYYQRFDALLGGNVHIALWGKIDLNKDKVKMTLGISPATLHARFNVSGISKKQMFQVKMRGSTEKLELDWSSAYGRIGVLMAKSAGGIGSLIGGLLEGIVTAGEEETPPPVTYPFPWETHQQ